MYYIYQNLVTHVQYIELFIAKNETCLLQVKNKVTTQAEDKSYLSKLAQYLKWNIELHARTTNKLITIRQPSYDTAEKAAALPKREHDTHVVCLHSILVRSYSTIYTHVIIVELLLLFIYLFVFNLFINFINIFMYHNKLWFHN